MGTVLHIRLQAEEWSLHKILSLSQHVCVAQSVEQPTHDFSSGHEPRVVGQSHASGSMLTECEDSLSLCPSLLLALSLK